MGVQMKTIFHLKSNSLYSVLCYLYQRIQKWQTFTVETILLLLLLAWLGVFPWVDMGVAYGMALLQSVITTALCNSLTL